MEGLTQIQKDYSRVDQNRKLKKIYTSELLHKEYEQLWEEHDWVTARGMVTKKVKLGKASTLRNSERNMKLGKASTLRNLVKKQINK